MDNDIQAVHKALNGSIDSVEEAIARVSPEIQQKEVGQVTYVGRGIAQVKGLPAAKAEELLLFPDNLLGMAFNLDRNEIGVILLGDYDHLKAGHEVKRTGNVVDVPVGEALIGRVIDPTGEPLDGKGSILTDEHLAAERKAPPIMHRAPVSVPLQTGIKVIDALIPIGRGQRELILGDRQTGKTAVALDTIINQKNEDVLCVYCAIGQRSASIARFVADLKEHDALDYSIVVVAEGDDPPGLQFIAPYAATSIAEYFMARGRDVLIVYDDLTRHAQAYRELSLLLRRPPGREAFPGDIFYIHSRLLERSTHLRKEYGGGSLTALPVIETEAQNISAYIPTNLISITDGQIYLSPDLFQKGLLPPVDVGKSVSRVGGKAQLPAFRAVTGHLRLSYSQFEELEAFSRFGTRLDEDTRKTLEHGYRVRGIFKQPQYAPVPVVDQFTVLLAASKGLFDEISVDKLPEAEQAIARAVEQNLSGISAKIINGEMISDDDQQHILETAKTALAKI